MTPTDAAPPSRARSADDAPSVRPTLRLAAAGMAAWLAIILAAALLEPRLAPGSAAAEAARGVRGAWRDGVFILAVAAAAALAWARLGAARVRAWMPAATAEGLGAIRAWIALILLASVLWEDLPSTAYLPRGMLRFDKQYLVEALHGLPIGVDRLMASVVGLQVYEAVTIALLLMAMAGLFTRWTVPLAAVAYLLLASILRSYAWFYHTGLVPLYCLALLSFTPCGDAFSLDRWRRRRKGLPVQDARTPAPRYGLGRYLVWMGIALPYTMAGLSKLRNGGFGWWRGDHMKQMLVSTSLDPMHFDFELSFLLLGAPAWFFDALGLAAVLGEATFVLVLVGAFWRRLLPLVMAGMHVGILLLQNILFPDLIAIQAVFYEWSGLRERAAAAFGRARRTTARAVEGARAAVEGGPAPDGATRRQAVVARTFLAVATVAWITRSESFPLTAMQMFSRLHPSQPVRWVYPVVRYEDGTAEEARFDRWIGAMADSRYRWLLLDWEKDPERIPRLREFLDACAARANAGLPPGKRIDRFELEVRRWDFRRDPRDPGRGRVEGVLVHEV